MADYKNIPVDKDTYIAVKLIAELNGLGPRGMGAQVRQWANRELPECDHPKEPVTIQIFPNQDTLSGTLLHRTGWYCPTCRRVYERAVSAVSGETVTVTAEANDPYGQPVPVKAKKRTSRRVTA